MAADATATRTKLFDERVVFQFYSKSRDVYPGKGPGESIPSELEKEFSELDKIKDWRKKLSNFWTCNIEIDGLKWTSVEHFYHANKYKRNCPEFYRKFSLSNNSNGREAQWIKDLPQNLATEPAVAKSLGGKTGRYKGRAYRPKGLLLDEGFFENGKSERVMKVGQRAKYMQNKELADVLLATKNAKLVHFIRRQRPMVFMDTMEIRNELSAASQKQGN